MKEHHLKTWPEYFAAVERGDKPFELRNDDRGFEVGDVLVLHEWEPDQEICTGRVVERVVVYVLRDAFWLGLRRGYAILGLRAKQGM